MIKLNNGKQGGIYMEKSTDLIEYLQENHTEELNAVGARELSTLFNITQRGLRTLVTELRKEGYPVCSSNSGYWYSEDEEDIRKTVARMEAQMEKMEQAVTGLKTGKYRRI